MNNDLFNFASIIGLSSVVSALITYILERFRKKQEIRFAKVFEEKYRRYNHILASMLLVLDATNLENTILEPGKKKQYHQILLENGEVELKEFLLKEIQSYINFYYLFASTKVLKVLYSFLETPNKDNYIKVACKMKKDLWK